MSFREMAEMMTVLPRGKSNPFPSCFKTRMQKLPRELKYNQVTTQIDPPQDFFFGGWAAFHAGFLLKKPFFFSFMGAGGGPGGRGKHAWNVTSPFSCLFV